MKISYLTIFLFLTLLSCSKNDKEEVIEPTERLEIVNVSPARVKIGDTIKITGNRLDLIEKLVFFNEKQTHPNDQPLEYYKSGFITQTENEISVQMRWFYHEEVTIDFQNLDKTTWDLELYGMIPIIHDFERIEEIQVMDDNIAFLKNDSNVYKSINGFHTWTSIFQGQVTDMHFLDQLNGWIATGWDGNIKIYKTENGGSSFDLKYDFSLPEGQGYIRKLHITSDSAGYFVTNEPQMYKIENNSYRNIFDVYPNLNEQGLLLNQIWDFTVVEEDLMFLITNRTGDPLIKIDNQNIILNQFEKPPLDAPQFIGNSGYILTENELYKSSDQGNSWTKLNSFENSSISVHFINEQFGFMYGTNGRNPPYLNQTFDGGVTWKPYYTFPAFGTGYYQGNYHDFSSTNGLFGFLRSLFKYKP